MPEREVRRRGGAVRYRTKVVGKGAHKKYFRIVVVKKPGKRGGHTVAGALRDYKRNKRSRRIG